MWLRHKSFKDIVKSEWNQAHKSSWVGLQFYYKLNCLKYRLKDGTRTLLAIYFKSKTNCLPESSNLTEKKQNRAFGSKIVVIEVGLKKSLCKLLPVRKLIGDKKLGLNGCRKEVTIQSSFTPLPMLAEQSIGFQICILMDPYATTHSDWRRDHSVLYEGVYEKSKKRGLVLQLVR